MGLKFSNVNIDSEVMSLKLQMYFLRCKSVVGEAPPSHVFKKLRRDIARSIHKSLVGGGNV
ncbi:50S ribosomal protein L29 [Candidatus Gromoviella agglomerans]|uniref:50S ribosomal protein L29 n=1 Tax=Candidatus Gromoviella agglomerans TaxID=2806609 RepID=UPI001E46EF3E|nr:50S ribosomal protein L29 [Candidatus Gromoviella agglomerans]UFX98567.1 hypothetical protein Gromo_00484 [Candidatus Gromoviella agglomerans]